MARRAGVLTLTVSLAAAAAFAQQSPDEQARRLLQDGRAYWQAGKLKQALDNFQTIVTGFPGTDSVDDALLEIGRYQAEVDHDPDKARESFDQVAKRFPQSDGAPGAYYHLGALTLSGASTVAELEDALAQFTRVERLYPRSDWVPRALYGTSLAHRRAARLSEAVDAARRVSLEYPTSDAAPSAQFEIGHDLALLGEYRRAMEEFQQVRNRFPQSPEAKLALDRITALYRLYGGDRPGFAGDPSFAVGAGDALRDVAALLATPDGTVWIASEKTKSAIPFPAAGGMGAAVLAEEPKTLALAPSGDVVLTSKLAVRVGPTDLRGFSVPGDKPGAQEPLKDLSAAVLTRGGAMLLADKEKKRVYRFEKRDTFKGTFPDGREREITRMVVDSEGGIVMLDREARTVQVVDETGKLLRTLALRGTGFDLRKPADVAVDAFRNLYVVDEEGGLYLFSPSGQLLATLGREELRKPRAVTVDPAGAVLVYDEKVQRVLRYR